MGEERLTSTLTPNSARALICCSVAVTGTLDFSVCACGESWRDSSGSAGVTEEVDLRGGILDGFESVRSPGVARG